MREKFYNQVQTSQSQRCTACLQLVLSLLQFADSDAGCRWLAMVGGDGAGGSCRWRRSCSLHRTRLGYNKSRDINIWKQSVRGLHSECLRFCLAIFLPSFLPSVFFFANIQLPSPYSTLPSSSPCALIFVFPSRRLSSSEQLMCLFYAIEFMQLIQLVYAIVSILGCIGIDDLIIILNSHVIVNDFIICYTIFSVLDFRTMFLFAKNFIKALNLATF